MTSIVMTTLPQFDGLRASKISAAPVQGLATVQPMRRKANGALGAKCGDFIGSSTNLIMVTSTTLMLFAGRFGLAPSANRKATAGLKLEARDSGLQTGDPAGFTLADTLACGTVAVELKEMEEVMILKHAAAKMGVKQMSSTAYLSESEEEAMIMSQEQSIRFLKEITDTDLEIEGSRRRKPPHLVRRDSRDSRVLPKMMWYKPQNRLFMTKEEGERAQEEFLLFVDSLLKAKEEAIVLEKPSQGLKLQN